MRFAFHFPSWPLESHSFGLKYGHFRYHQLQKCPNSKNYFVKAQCGTPYNFLKMIFQKFPVWLRFLPLEVKIKKKLRIATLRGVCSTVKWVLPAGQVFDRGQNPSGWKSNGRFSMNPYQVYQLPTTKGQYRGFYLNFLDPLDSRLPNQLSA